ncbi:MAG TPA: hypothetical protein VI076_03525 [Actinopolymorphaceae bacterium]
MKVKDLLWRLETRAHALGPRPVRRRIVTELRRTTVIRDLRQRRLQAMTSAQLSAFMAELQRVDHAHRRQ